MLERKLCVYNAGLKVDVSQEILTVIMMSKSLGQERAKRIAKNKTHDKLLCVFYASKHFRNTHYRES